jgi:hypothetical protein
MWWCEMRCKHGHEGYCGFCRTETAPKCGHGNAFYCGHCGPVKDSPGMPPGQAAGRELPVGAQEAEEKKQEPGPEGTLIGAPPAREENDEPCSDCGGLVGSPPCGSCFGHGSIERARREMSSVPPSTWLPPGASEPESTREYTPDEALNVALGLYEEGIAGEALGLTDAQVESALRKAGKLAAEVDDARAARVHSRVFGKDGGT